MSREQLGRAVLGGARDIGNTLSEVKAMGVLGGLGASLAAVKQVARPLSAQNIDTRDTGGGTEDSRNDNVAGLDAGADNQIDGGSAPISDADCDSLDLEVVFSHYISETLQFEEKLRKVSQPCLGLLISRACDAYTQLTCGSVCVA